MSVNREEEASQAWHTIVGNIDLFSYLTVSRDQRGCLACQPWVLRTESFHIKICWGHKESCSKLCLSNKYESLHDTVIHLSPSVSSSLHSPLQRETPS